MNIKSLVAVLMRIASIGKNKVELGSFNDYVRMNLGRVPFDSLFKIEG